ncbi:phage tail assembly chaperone [Stenotrophomonas sp. GD03908]|uniref:tail fiber assembly protein n=1 Tax=Stenotrophomonas TaxID=40323 RepID=UPI0018EB5174|nr:MULTISPECIES: tail fiber assembly protein [Stenotrophomonas]MDH0977737.1 phage tail assembly chaperone [Stenotrophomonas sp. GD03908]
MSAEFYAVTDSSFRAVGAGAPLNPGESLVQQIPSSILAKIKANEVLVERSQRLRDTDWTQMADAPLTAAEKLAHQVYRQALRDIPSLPGFPNITWPVPPALNDGAASGAEIPVTP